MLVISVVVVAVVGASYAFVPTFATGVEALGDDVARILGTGSTGLSDSTAGAPTRTDSHPGFADPTTAASGVVQPVRD